MAVINNQPPTTMLFCDHGISFDAPCVQCDEDLTAGRAEIVELPVKSPPAFEPVCDCGSLGRFSDEHKLACGLFYSDEFFSDLAEWDHVTQKLIYLRDEIGNTAVTKIQSVYEGFSDLQKARWHEAYEVDDHEAMEQIIDEVCAAELTDTLPDALADTRPVVSSVVGSSGAVTSWTYTKCAHYQQAVTLPDDTVVYGSSSHWDRKGDPIPALGIYLDGCWKPDTIAFHVGCPDHGVPYLKVWQVLHIAREGLRMAREMERVEIGCIGGHGRTGMMLGVMAVIAAHDAGKPMTGKDAVKYVRDKYCKEAIESSVQEWYIDGVAHELRGERWPVKPKLPRPVYYTPSTRCVACNHYLSHDGDNPCKAWNSVTSNQCACTEDNNSVKVAANQTTGIQPIAPMARKLAELAVKDYPVVPVREQCFNAPIHQTFVSCELKAGHLDTDAEPRVAFHACFDKVGALMRQWWDGDGYSKWVY